MRPAFATWQPSASRAVNNYHRDAKSPFLSDSSRTCAASVDVA